MKFSKLNTFEVLILKLHQAQVFNVVLVLLACYISGIIEITYKLMFSIKIQNL